MAGGDLTRIAGVYLAGDSRMTWVVAEQPVEADSFVVIEAGDRRRIGRVRVQPGQLVSGAPEPEGRIIAPADENDLDGAATSLSVSGGELLGGIGRLSPPAGESRSHPFSEEFERRLPRLGDRIRTEQGDGEVVRLILHEGRMVVRLDSGEEIEIAR